MIIDQVHLLIQAGKGGNGCESYYYRPDKKRISNGGNGGKGGSVIFRTSKNAPPIANLRFKQHLIAESGEHGKSNKKRGKNGEDMVILLPPGSRVFDREKQLLIRDLRKEDEEVVVAQGGQGGSGNFGGKTATFGEEGQVFDIEIRTRIQADVFMVGLPNSGKSTLLNYLTRARVKQEDYPFATQHPEIGVWECSEFEQMTLCEMPSIYETSHQGRGVGVDFLKHLESAKIIVYMIEPFSQFANSLEEGFLILKKQIERFSKEFLEIPAILLINKIDLPEAEEKALAERFDPQIPVFKISASTGQGIDEVTEYLKEKVEISI